MHAQDGHAGPQCANIFGGAGVGGRGCNGLDRRGGVDGVRVLAGRRETACLYRTVAVGGRRRGGAQGQQIGHGGAGDEGEGSLELDPFETAQGCHI